VQSLLLQLHGFFSLFSASINHFDVVIEYCSNDGNHICFYHPRPDILRASDPNIDNALESQIPFPHIHHIFASPRLEKAYQSLNTSIDCQDVPYPCGGGRQICKVVQGIDEW
jgi:hypothetical protein